MENKVFKIDELSKIFHGKGGPTVRSWADKGFVHLKKEGRYILGFDEVLLTAAFIKFYDLGIDARFSDRLAKKISLDHWRKLREENKTFFVLKNFEHAKDCQVCSVGESVVLDDCEGIIAINGREIFEKVTDKIDRHFF